MGSRRYRHVPAPWRAAVDVTSAAPSRFYAALIRQALRYGLPARRRLGALQAFVGRRGVPQALLVGMIRRFPARLRPDLDQLLDRVAENWPRLAGRSVGLSPDPPRLSALALQRSAGLTVFAFGEVARPLLVLKIPPPGDPRVDVEMRALEEAELAGVAPRPLGRVGEARVQEGLGGSALRVEPITRLLAGHLAWSPEHASIAEGLAALARTTAGQQRPDELRDPLERAIADGPLSQPSRRLLARAWQDLAGLEVSVLRHGDASPQNCLVSEGRLVGLVDWEIAEPLGTPGFDVWNAAVAWFEHGVGLVRWSEDRVMAAFEAAWDSPFWTKARAAGRDSALAAGVPEQFLDPLEVAFFGRRLGRRLADPTGYATGPRTAARMLELACAR